MSGGLGMPWCPLYPLVALVTLEMNVCRLAGCKHRPKHTPMIIIFKLFKDFPTSTFCAVAALVSWYLVMTAPMCCKRVKCWAWIVSSSTTSEVQNSEFAHGMLFLDLHHCVALAAVTSRRKCCATLGALQQFQALLEPCACSRDLPVPLDQLQSSSRPNTRATKLLRAHRGISDIQKHVGCPIGMDNGRMWTNPLSKMDPTVCKFAHSDPQYLAYTCIMFAVFRAVQAVNAPN